MSVYWEKLLFLRFGVFSIFYFGAVFHSTTECYFGLSIHSSSIFTVHPLLKDESEIFEYDYFSVTYPRCLLFFTTSEGERTFRKSYGRNCMWILAQACSVVDDGKPSWEYAYSEILWRIREQGWFWYIVQGTIIFNRDVHHLAVFNALIWNFELCCEVYA